MGQEVVSTGAVTEGLPDPEAPSCRKTVEHSYSRELLLSYANLENCKKTPENLDPHVLRDAPTADIAEGAIAIPVAATRGLVRRDSDLYSKSPQDIPEWRKDSWRAGGSVASLQQGPRRKLADEEPPGNAFSTSYPPRPAANWGDNVHLRNSYDNRATLHGQGSGRWDHRIGLGDREKGRPVPNWDGAEEIVPIVPLDGPRSFGSGSPVVRPGWIPTERDGLLGSGGNVHGGSLHRTYTGSFTTPSTIRVVPERHNSMGRIDSRTLQPYQASRSLKVAPTFVRREDTDFVNDETFGGSEEISNEERMEQERKRRESFELMRKDHQRQLQEQQKFLTQKHEERLANPEAIAIRKHDENTLWDDSLISDGMPSSSPRSPEKYSMSDSQEIIPSGVSLSVVAPSTPRPAIPPGFAKTLQQMQTTTTASATKETPMEGDSSDISKDISKLATFDSDTKDDILVDEAIKLDDKVVPLSHDSFAGKVVAHSSQCVTRSESLIVGSPTELKENLLETQRPGSESNNGRSEGWNFKMQVIADNKKQAVGSDNVKENIFVGVDEYNKTQESLLDKWFGRTKSGQVSVKDGLLPSHHLVDEERNRLQTEEPWVEGDSRMSKFAQWFHQEEKQQLREGGGIPSNIMSFLSKSGPAKATSSQFKDQVVESPRRANSNNHFRNHGRVLPMPTGPSLEDIEKGLTANASAAADHEQIVTKESILLSALSLKNLEVEHKGDQLTGIFGEHSPVGKFKFQPIPLAQASSSSKSSPVFLTCEDIEQSILAEAGSKPDKKASINARISRVGGEAYRKGEPGGAPAADNSASRHLLSLLQKGTVEQKHSIRGGLPTTESFGEKEVADGDDNIRVGEWGQSSNSQKPSGSKKSLSSENPTLEALFGKAFMSELRSVEAPVSSKTFAGDYFGNGDGAHVGSGGYSLSRQSSGRMSNNSGLNSNASKPWIGTIGPMGKMDWSESKWLEANRHGHVTDLSVPRQKVNHYLVQDQEENLPGSSSVHGFWGNGVNALMANGGTPINTSGGNTGSFVSSLEGNSFVGGDVVEISLQGKGHSGSVPTSDLEVRKSLKVNGEGENLSSGNFASVQMRVTEDIAPPSQGKSLSNDEPAIVPSTSFDSTGLSKVFTDDRLKKRMVGEGNTGKFASTELGATSREESTIAASQTVDSFLSASHKIDRREITEDVNNIDKVGVGDEMNSGNDRKMSDALSEALGLSGKGKEGNSRAAIAGFPEPAITGSLSRSVSNNRYKANSGGMQSVSGFSAFQPSAPPLQHPQQSIGAVYRSDPPPPLSLQPRQSSSIPGHHHLQHSPSLQRSPSSGSLSMFPPPPFRPQPGLPQQQQILAPSFSNGSPMEYPHVAYGHGPGSSPGRPMSAGHLHFPPSHGHLSPPGGYHTMGHMGLAPNHFMPPAQMPQRGPVMSSMTEAHMYMPEQSLHDPHGMSPKPGPQQGPGLFPLGGHALHSGQGPMYHQPLGHNLRGQQNQLLPAPAPWVPPYGPDFMRTGSKGHDSPSFVNGSGGGVGGGGAVDRWFGMDLSRNLSGIPSPGLIQLSPHGLESDSKMRFG